jgi:FAD/FMN-containing dehydrogenase
MIGIGSTWTEPAEDKQRIAELRRRWALVEPHTGGFYANLREETASRTEKNFGPNYDRLVALKNAYDPMNLFRLNANVKPTV